MKIDTQIIIIVDLSQIKTFLWLVSLLALSKDFGFYFTEVFVL